MHARRWSLSASTDTRVELLSQHHTLCSSSSIGLFTHQLKHQKNITTQTLKSYNPKHHTSSHYHTLSATPVQLSQKPPGDLYQLTPEPITTPTNQIKMTFLKSLSRVVDTLFLAGMGRPVFTSVVLVGAARTRVLWKPCFQPSCDRHFVLRDFLGLDDRLYASLVGTVFTYSTLSCWSKTMHQS